MSKDMVGARSAAASKLLMRLTSAAGGQNARLRGYWAYYEALGLPFDADAFIAGLQDEMRAGLAPLDAILPRNPHVRITSRQGQSFQHR